MCQDICQFVFGFHKNLKEVLVVVQPEDETNKTGNVRIT
jgi:hypothetical protein